MRPVDSIDLRSCPISRTVNVWVDNFSAIEVAVQLVAQGVDVALLLRDQARPWIKPGAVPPRRLAAKARNQAGDLLARAGHTPSEDFLESAASLFGVAKWPASVSCSLTMSTTPKGVA